MSYIMAIISYVSGVGFLINKLSRSLIAIEAISTSAIFINLRLNSGYTLKLIKAYESTHCGEE